MWASSILAPESSRNITIKLLDIRAGKLAEFELSRRMSAARGGFDRNGNAWFGGRGGSIVELDTRQRKVREYWPPVATAEFHEAMPDRCGRENCTGLDSSG
jgi:streptogramin lyase